MIDCLGIIFRSGGSESKVLKEMNEKGDYPFNEKRDYPFNEKKRMRKETIPSMKKENEKGDYPFTEKRMRKETIPSMKKILSLQ